MTITEGVVTTLNGEAASIDEGALQEFSASFGGQLIWPGEAEYDQARRIWNGMIDKYPALIARCTGTADVVDAVKFARATGIQVAVRGGGHNVAGLAVVDGGLVIDLSPMKGIHVDPDKQTVRAQPGVIWRELDRETQLFGLATTGGEVSTTGIAGYTLSGGLGMLQRKHGLACDNLLSVEIVTAEGDVLQASHMDYPDLFWAVRGGGGNFGIVTWFEFQLHPLGPEVYSSTVIYSLDDAPSILRSWHDYLEHAPDEVTTQVIFWTVPPVSDFPEEMHGVQVAILVGLYAGPAADGERALAPLSEFGTPLADLSGIAPYTEVQSAFDEFAPPGLNYYWKSLYLDELNDDLTGEVIKLAANRPTPETLIVLRQLGGAVSQVPEDATAYGNRRAQFNLSLDSIAYDPKDAGKIVAWTRRTWDELREKTGGGVYLNFAGLGEEGAALARAGHQRNYERLQEIKRRYDPTNFFRGNINITP